MPILDSKGKRFRRGMNWSGKLVEDKHSDQSIFIVSTFQLPYSFNEQTSAAKKRLRDDGPSKRGER